MGIDQSEPADTSIFRASPLHLRAEWFSGKRKAELMKPQAWHKLLAQGTQLATFFSHQQKSLKVWGLRSLSFLLFKGQARLEGNVKDIDKDTKGGVSARVRSVRPRSCHSLWCRNDTSYILTSQSWNLLLSLLAFPPSPEMPVVLPLLIAV